MNLTITFPQLAAALAQATGSSQSTAETFIRQLFDYISSELFAGTKRKHKGTRSLHIRNVVREPHTLAARSRACRSGKPAIRLFEPVELNDGVTEEVLSTPPSTDTDKKEDEPAAVSEVKTDDNDTLPAPNPTTLRLPAIQAMTKSRPKLPMKNRTKRCKSKKSHRL